MSVHLSSIPYYHYNSTEYSFSVIHSHHNSIISMQVHSGIYSTAVLPRTFEILEELLPSIFKSDCFNDLQQPFSQEVKKTEIAHLFEHILLEYLCKLKVQNGDKNVVINGVTTWNWNVNPMGSFDITIDTGFKDKHLFALALEKSKKLFDLILESNERLLN